MRGDTNAIRAISSIVTLASPFSNVRLSAALAIASRAICFLIDLKPIGAALMTAW